MKRLFVATAIILFFLAIFVVENYTIKSAYRDVAETLDIHKIDEQTVRLASEQWQKHKTVVTLFAGREKAEDISSCFSNLKITQPTDRYEYLINIIKIKDIFDEMLKTEGFSISGVL